MNGQHHLEDIDLETLTAILNAVGEGITVQGADGRLIWANEAAAVMSGFDTAEELLSAPTKEVLEKFRLFEGEGTIPMDLRRLPGRLALAGEHPPEVLVRWINARTGEERWSLIRATPVVDDAGKVLYAVNAFRDVTERQLAITGLQQSERRYAQLYEERALAAKTLSEALLPSKFPEVAGLELAAFFRTADEGVGGDFYDVVKLADGRWLLAMADVSGKGAEAAALTAMARYTLRTLARVNDSPAALLEAVNLVLVEDFPEGKFCSMAAAALDRHDGVADVTLVVAGHPLPLVVRASGEVSAHGTTGLPLGAFVPLDLTEDQLSLGKGDSLVMFTDGCVGEGADALQILGPVLFGLAEEPLASIPAAVEKVAAEVQQERPDDSAVLAARVSS